MGAWLPMLAHGAFASDHHNLLDIGFRSNQPARLSGPHFAVPAPRSTFISWRGTSGIWWRYLHGQNVKVGVR